MRNGRASSNSTYLTKLKLLNLVVLSDFARIGCEMQYLAVKLRQNFTFLTKFEPFWFVFIEVLHSLETRTLEEIEKQYVQVKIPKDIASRTGALFLKNLNLVLAKWRLLQLLWFYIEIPRQNLLGMDGLSMIKLVFLDEGCNIYAVNVSSNFYTRIGIWKMH